MEVACSSNTLEHLVNIYCRNPKHYQHLINCHKNLNDLHHLNGPGVTNVGREETNKNTMYTKSITDAEMRHVTLH